MKGHAKRDEEGESELALGHVTDHAILHRTYDADGVTRIGHSQRRSDFTVDGALPVGPRVTEGPVTSRERIFGT